MTQLPYVENHLEGALGAEELGHSTGQEDRSEESPRGSRSQIGLFTAETLERANKLRGGHETENLIITFTFGPWGRTGAMSAVKLVAPMCALNTEHLAQVRKR